MRPLRALALVVSAAAWLACGAGERPAQRGGAGGEIGAISGSVTLEGREDADLTGIIVFCAGTNHVAFTDAAGSYRFTGLPLGQYHVHARHEGFQQTPIGEIALTADSPRAQIEPVALVPRAPASLDLPLPADGGLAGVARKVGGVDHGGINVSLQGTSHSTLTDSQGRWMLRDIAPGEYVLALAAPGHAARSTRVTVMPAQIVDVPEQTLAVATGGDDKPEGDRRIVGIVALIGPNDTLLSDHSGVTVLIEGTERRVQPDREGRFVFEGLAPAVHTLSARAEGFVADPGQSVDLTERAEAEVTLFLESEAAVLAAELGSIRGRVVVARGGQADGIPIAIAGTSITVTTASDGTFDLAGLAPGEATVVVRAPGYQTVRREGVEVLAGEQVDIGDITLEPAFPVPRVIATRPADGQREVLLQPQIPVVVEFSETMNAASVKGAVTLDPPVPHTMFMGSEHPQTNERILLIQLQGGEQAVGFRERIEVTIGQGAESVQGMALENPHQFAFTMGRPGIYAARPADGEMLSSTSDSVDLHFNTRIDPSDLAQKFAIHPDPPQVPYFFHEIDPQTGWSIVEVQCVFAPGREYRVEANARLRTATGARLGPERSTSFMTAEDTLLRDRDGNPVGDGGQYVY